MLGNIRVIQIANDAVAVVRGVADASIILDSGVDPEIRGVERIKCNYIPRIEGVVPSLRRGRKCNRPEPVANERIARCMSINAATWLEVAERGYKAGVVHWKVAAICRTLASYAAGGWDKKPSARQAKPALEAFQACQSAGVIAGTAAAEAGAIS